VSDDLAFVRRRAAELGPTLNEDDLAELARDAEPEHRPRV